MPQSGYTPIQLYRSTTAVSVPLAADLNPGELAINTTDEKIYFKNTAGDVKLLAANLMPVANGGTGLTSFTSDGVVYASGTSTLTTGSALTFNGVNLHVPGGGGLAGNEAFGTNALYNNTGGSGNTACGDNALASNTDGYHNTACGRNALAYNTIGGYDTACGYMALYHNTTGNRNTACGYFALYANTTGNYNTACGGSALYTITTGSGNIGIGGVNSAGTYTPAFDIINQNNYISMGSSSVTNAYIKVAWTVTSDARDKMDVATVPHGLDFVLGLKPVSYKFRWDRESENANGGTRYGFLAQDVLALEGDSPVVVDAQDSEHLRTTDEMITPILVKAIQELTARVAELEAKLS